jgi:hypothetical protein
MPQERRYQTGSERQAAYRSRQAQARRNELADLGLPPLPTISTMPGTARWKGALRWCVALLTLVRDEMSSYYDQRSESWQEGDCGAVHQERIEALEVVLDALEQLSF